MGMKYMIKGFNYPYSYLERMIQTRWLPVAIFWFVVFCFKYDGVDMGKRR